MTVNNYSYIRDMLKFESPHDFYFLQVIKRRKDNPGMSKDQRLIQSYFVDNLKYFDSIQQRLIEQCETNNARSYINLNVRDANKVASDTIKRIVDYSMEGKPLMANRAFETACGKGSSDRERKWVIDLDNDTGYEATEVCEYIRELFTKFKSHKQRQLIYDVLPTKSGLHVVSSPFNITEFIKRFPGLSVHKNSPVLLHAV